MENGFIFIPREFLDGSIWKEKRAYSEALALIDLHMMARYGAGPAEVVVANRRVRVEHGQLVASLRYLGSRWRWSVGRVRRFVALLRDGGWIAADTTEGILRITVPDGVGAKLEEPHGQPLADGGDVPGRVPGQAPPAAPRHTAGYTSGTVCGTKKKKGRKEEKETSLTGGKERLSPSPTQAGEVFQHEVGVEPGSSSEASAEPPYRPSGHALRETASGTRADGGTGHGDVGPAAGGRLPGGEQKGAMWERPGAQCGLLRPYLRQAAAGQAAGRWLRVAEVEAALMADGRWLDRVRERANLTAARPVAGKERAVSVPQKLEIKRIASLLQGFDGGKDRADVVERIDRFLTAVLLQGGGEHFVERHPRTFNSR